MLEESENVNTPIETEKIAVPSVSKEPENNEELMVRMAGEPEIRNLNYYSDTDEEFHGFDSDDEAWDVNDYGNVGCQVGYKFS